MSWLSNIIGIGATLLSGSGGWLGSIAKTVSAGYILNKVTSSVNKSQTANEPDPGVRLQVNPDPNHKIPVVYGTATIGGIVTDAVLTNSNQTMWYCLTICEQTGLLNLGQGAASQLFFDEIYWNDQKINFASDGITAASTVDRDGTVDTKIDAQVKVYCFSGASNIPIAPGGYTLTNPTAANNLMPNWTSSHNMPATVFALVRVDYNKEKNITGLANMTFKIRNTMTKSGDCLYDYLTNDWYGAGIDANRIYVS
jgi:hypothetical protein